MSLARYRSRVVASILSVTIAFGIGSVIIILLRKDPVLAIATIFSGSLGNSSGLGSTLNLAAVLLLTGLAALVAFSGGIFNVGMEGQLYVGGLAAVAVSIVAPEIGLVAIPVAVLVGIIFGALYSVVPAVLKAKLSVNEIVTTLLLNFVALLFVNYMTGGPLHQPGSALPRTPPIPDGYRLPIIPGSTVSSSIFVAILASTAIAFLLRRSRFGFEIRIMGGNLRAAKYVGIGLARNTVLAMLISGAMAGLAGTMLALGTTYFWFAGVSKFYGYLGIGVALLAQLNPIAIILSAIFFAVLNQGGIVMQSVSGVPFEVAQVMAAMIVIVTLIRPVLERASR